MEKEDILAISRKENKNRDLTEVETALQAGSVAARVGAGMCCLMSIVWRRNLRWHGCERRLSSRH